MSGRLQRAFLGASLALNAVLAAGLWVKSADTRAHYWARALATPSPTPPPRPLAEVRLGSPPPSAPPPLAGELAALQPAWAYKGQRGPAFTAWRRGVTGALDATLGGTQASVVLEARLVARSTFAAVVREKWYLRLADGTWLPAWLLMPRAPAGPRAAVVALPGHDAPQPEWGRGAADVADTGKPHNYMGGYGMKLAEAGYIVLAIDVAGIGELAYLNYTRLAKQGLLIDRPLAGRMVTQVRAALGWLRERPGVAPNQVGAVGLSLGGMLALYTAIVDPRVAFAADAGYFLSYRDLSDQAAAASFLPGILLAADLPDLAGAVAPRPLLLQADPGDPIAHAADLAGYARRTAAVYAGAGAPDAFTFQPHARGHRIDVQGLVAWLKRVART